MQKVCGDVMCGGGGCGCGFGFWCEFGFGCGCGYGGRYHQDRDKRIKLCCVLVVRYFDFVSVLLFQFISWLHLCVNDHSIVLVVIKQIYLQFII